MDIKLKNLLRNIDTSQRIRITNRDYEEEFYPAYGDLQDFNEYYVVDVCAYERDVIGIGITESI